MTQTIVNSNAKIIFFGEHSVVYNEPAIALPLKNVQTTVTINDSSKENWIDSRYYSGPLEYATDNLASLKVLIEQCLFLTNHSKSFLNIKIESEIPSERGMGSSAATAVAIVRGIFKHFARPLTHHELLDIVAISEKIIHGSPSGLDAATTSSKQPVWFEHGQVIAPIELNINGYLVISDSGIKGKTSTAVNIVKQRVLTSTDSKQAIHKLGLITRQAAIAIKFNKLQELGGLMNDAQTKLAGLGISIPEVDQLISTANANGALGSKLTGGGLGGCVISLVDNKSAAQNLSKSLLDAGATATWIEKL